MDRLSVCLKMKHIAQRRSISIPDDGAGQYPAYRSCFMKIMSWFWLNAAGAQWVGGE
jgi:hypothetical protein